MKDTIVLSSPTSLLGKSVAKQFADKGCNLVFLTWRSDLAEKLMIDVLAGHDIQIMIIRQDLVSSNWATKVWNHIKIHDLEPSIFVRIPNIEENTKPFSTSQANIERCLRNIESNFNEFSSIMLNNNKVTKIVDTKLNPIEIAFDKYNFILFRKLQNMVNFLNAIFGNILYSLNIVESEILAKRILFYLNYNTAVIKLTAWDYFVPIKRVVLTKLLNIRRV